MKLGLILPRRGPSGLWAAGCEAAAFLAVAEINAAGGVRGEPVRMAVACSGETPADAAEAAGALQETEHPDAVIGFQPSHMRHAVRARLAGAVPYFYTPQYEGGYPGPGTLALGVTDEEALRPALSWLMDARGVRRCFFVGNDYIWPRTAHGTAHDAMAQCGLQSCGSAIIPFGTEDYEPLLATIRRAAPDLVITVLLGEETVRFNRAFAAAGMAARSLRLALAMDETLLLGIGPDAAENLFAAETFFAGNHGRADDPMLALYDAAYGRSLPPVNVFSLGCYNAIRLVADLAGEAGRSDAKSLLTAMRRPHARRSRLRPIHIAEADGTGFRVRATL
ncbi:MAG: ABC transporter substrate-binding protein [Pikeienuella sp.]|uniref:ABC transporter substrate-binding protein n=1 Tax=Pikeienuella sp. TaxID=2831957 RepID=UPI003918FF6E